MCYDCGEEEECQGHPEEDPMSWIVPFADMPCETCGDLVRRDLARVAQSSDVQWLKAITKRWNKHFVTAYDYLGAGIWVFPSNTIANLAWSEQEKYAKYD
jgi:hypothetical protein